MQPLKTRDEVDAAFRDPLAVVYKHSSRCPLSSDAYAEVSEFARAADVPVYVVDVIASRPLSLYVSERSSVTHQSPQVIVVQHGICAWHASHHRVSAVALRNQVDTLRGAN